MSEYTPLGALPLFASAARDREAAEIRVADPPFLTNPETSLERRFAEFHRSNLPIYRALANRCEQLLDQGRRRISIAELVEEIRHDPDIGGSRANPFKLNNSYRAFYSRLLIFRNKRLEGIIETRVQHSRDNAS